MRSAPPTAPARQPPAPVAPADPVQAAKLRGGVSRVRAGRGDVAPRGIGP
jgi:hypothetical protein